MCESETTGKTGAVNSLTPYASHSGNIAVSIDGIGTQSNTGAIQIKKPSSDADVRVAYLMTATIPFQHTLPDNSIELEGNPIAWDLVVSHALNFGNGKTGIADVTSIVKPIVDPAPTGLTDVTTDESGVGSDDVDGSVLVVVFDEPSAPTSTFVLAFGAQDPDGDNFAVTLGAPFDDITQDIEMSLGISFGFQTGSEQNSNIDVNGTRMTSSAGGQDECDVLGDDFCGNGTLLTVGGIGDDPANPADPFATTSTDPRADDELYTLDPLLTEGESAISVFTENPSDDDNIFFAGFFIRGTAAVIGEGILLTPPEDVNPIGSTHTVRAFLQDDAGDAVVGRHVDFEIVSGPNAGLTASTVTDADGEAHFSWTSASAGTDIVEASFISSREVRQSTTASKTWEESTGECDLPQIVSEEINNSERTITLVYEDTDGISQISYRYPADYPDASKAGEPALVNLNVSDNGGLSTTNGIDFSASSPYPTSVTHVLQAPEAGSVLYFPIITDACEDPGPQTYDADPIRAFADADGEVPTALTLHGNYPNPFNPSTTVRFALPEAADVTVEIYDLLGRRVATLLNAAFLSAGPHDVRFEAAGLPSGTYLVRVEAGADVKTTRMTLTK